MFIETSALVAMLTDPGDAADFGYRLSQAKNRLTSPIAVFEAAHNLSRFYDIGASDAREAVGELLHLLEVKVLAVPPTVSGSALDAYAFFGEGSDHPSRLTMTESFAYACARYYRVPLLYKCARFRTTDIERA